MANAANITRRNILKAAAASSVAVAPAVASAAPANVEHPWEKARRLADELTNVLNETDGGRWFARVYPNNHPDYKMYPIMFGDISADERWRREPSPSLMKLIEKHKRAYSEFSLACAEDDEERFLKYSTTEPGPRWKAASQAEDMAINAILLFSPANSVTWAAKADYLREVFKDCVLNEDQIGLLIDSMGGRGIE